MEPLICKQRVRSTGGNQDLQLGFDVEGRAMLQDGAFNVGDPTLSLVRTGLNGRAPSRCQRIVGCEAGRNTHTL